MQPFLEDEDCKVVILAHVITAASHVVETVISPLPLPSSTHVTPAQVSTISFCMRAMHKEAETMQAAAALPSP
jgi:hypothetical protein